MWRCEISDMTKAFVIATVLFGSSDVISNNGLCLSVVEGWEQRTKHRDNE
jgi:hypothetical protein